MIPAAGALPWRRRRGELQVALVHRPAYDDWAWSKGKLDPGEDWPVAAVREVEDRLGRLVQRVARLEQGAASPGAPSEQTPTTLGQRVARLEEQQRAEAARQLQNAGVYEGLEARLERLEAATTTPERPPERRPPWRRPR